MNRPPDSPAPAAPTVHRLTPTERGRWQAFVASSAQATFFHRAEWADVLERAFGHETHFLFAASAGQIVGVLPLARVRSRLFGHALTSLPFGVYGGIAADSAAAATALDTRARALARHYGVDYLEYRHCQPRFVERPTQQALYATFRKAIAPDPETNLQAIPRKQRRMVRKGIQAGLQSGFDTNLERFFPIFAANVHRMGTPVFSRRYFQCLLDSFGDDCRILTATRDGEAVATVMTFYFRDEVLPYYGAGTPAARQVAGYDFLYWELMRRACLAGYRCFDFGRSKRGTGSFSFKRNWGFEPQPLYYEYDLVGAREIPNINPLNPKYRVFIAAWKRLPLPVANWLGPRLSRSLG